MLYLVRIVNAQCLLERTKYSIGEVSEIVGYDNPLYFSLSLIHICLSQSLSARRAWIEIGSLDDILAGVKSLSARRARCV